MLKVINYEEMKKDNIEFDIYTPINIEFGTWNISKESTVYWRIGDFEKSLLEIGLGKYKKDIRSITLTICENVYEVENYFENDFNVLKGSPIFELENINDEMYLDENGILKVYIENESISIVFSENKIKNCIQNNNIYFYLDENKELIGIKINNVSKENKFVLKSALT